MQQRELLKNNGHDNDGENGHIGNNVVGNAFDMEEDGVDIHQFAHLDVDEDDDSEDQ